MSIKEYVEKMKRIHSTLLEFLEDESDSEENYTNFIKTITEYKIIEDKHDFSLLLRMINCIGCCHQRTQNFIHKIEQILSHFRNEIQKHFTNSEIFKLFGNNKLILLFLLQEKMIIIDEYIVSEITHNFYFLKMYPFYFAPEIKPFITPEFIKKYRKKNEFLNNNGLIQQIMKEVPNDFYDKRKEGVNDNYLCELIRKNLVKDFGIYINRLNIPPDSKIENSIFETINLLMDGKISLSEYAAFYGSNDIIKYLEINKDVELTSKMWNYAVISKNVELIKHLEDKKISPILDNFEFVLRAAIMCHHNDFANYLILNLMDEKTIQYNIKNNFDLNLNRYAIMYFNFAFFPENLKDENIFFYLCKNDFYTLVKLFLQEGNIDINARCIKTTIFF